MTAAARIPLDDDAGTWSRIQAYARWAVIDKADLDDTADLWRCLVARGVPAATAINLAPAVIERAREIIAEQETAQ